ncbi:multi-sensor signal transduction histidine kinase [Natronococcus amylolyticus DSM 10524]|uniref:histidine kinase n=1 Tax=Natronococcus amylolyticus DSM 10524 TaxID=1227497 RepID=L9XIQ9_9EURY|nr:PAS domain S-box protein [Natronococcus amylolyticus]ELY60543.1 multi-sensor signal transduction histidine kinase [Natronococcus amylolyticus DSM 10524]
MDTATRVVCVGSDVPPNVDGVFDEVVETLADCLAGLESADCVVATDTVPDATCAELCSRIRGRRPDLPLVVFPSSGSEELAGEVIAAGADGYVPQSQGLETLRSRLAALLSGSDSRSGEHSSRFELLVEQSPLAIIEWNRSFEAISWNPAATELFGYDRAEALGTSAFELVVGEHDRTDVAAQWELLVGADLEESSRAVTRNVRKDGTEVTCEWVNAPLITDGEVVRVLSFARDITDDLERANALEALQETTRQLVGASSFETIAEITMGATGSVLDRSLAGVWFADEDGEALELAATASQLADASVDRSPVTPSDSLLWEVYERGEPMVVEDASIERFPYYLEFPLGNAIVYPLGEHGVLSVCSVGGRELEATDMNLVRVLAATAEAALDRTARQRELERAKTIVDAVGDGVYATDREGRFVTVNDMLASITGYDRETLVGEHFSTVLTAESADRIRNQVGALEPGTEDGATYELTVLTESGERIPCESTTRLLCSGGDIEGSVGVVRDVSDRKRMERELRERRAKIENLHEVASRLDDCRRPEEIYELIVETAEDVLEFDVCAVDRAVGDSLVKVALSSHLDDTDYVDRIPIETGIAGKTYRTGRTYRIDDVERCEDTAADAGAYASVLSAPIGDHGVFQAASRTPGAFDRHDEELVELLLSHVTDRLDQLESESVLRAERDRFAALFENVPDAVASVQHRDGKPIVEAVNPAFERTFGYDEAELVGNSLDAHIVPFEDRDAAEAINRCSGEGSVVEAEVRRRTADGFREFMLRLVPIELGQTKSRSFALYTDVTEQKRRRKRLEILNRVLRHDLRNGMNVIDGCADLLADRVDGEVAARVETIRERANELTSLAEKSRTVERTLNRDGADTRPIDVAALAERVTTRLENDDPNVEIGRSISGPAPVSGGAYLETAIDQLLENAVEHHDGDPSIEVTVRDRPAEDLVALSVADDGPGIPTEERELLREEREITQLRHMNGLGLWLVNWAVSQSGGRLSIADNEPRGTVVTLEFPRADPDADGPTRG